jgi:hypothetical protein
VNQIAPGPNPLGHTNFDAKGVTTQTISKIASPPAGTVGPGPIDAGTIQRILDLETQMTAVEGELAYVYTGTGVPAIAASNGSIFLRTDGTTADTSIYSRIAGSWVAIKGAT